MPEEPLRRHVSGGSARRILNAQLPLVGVNRFGDDAATGGSELVGSEGELVSLAAALGASGVRGLSRKEGVLLRRSSPAARSVVRMARELIRAGADPLGNAFCALRPAEERRKDGAVYTPDAIVQSMLSWAETVGEPDRVIDPGAGSGRFVLEAGRRFPRAVLVAVESDPLAALTARANLAAAGMARRAEVRVEDFRASALNGFDGCTLYVGNPPYVRHHLISQRWKQWLKREARELGLTASALAGLHVYFFLAVASRARSADYGALITAAEWLDVNYGQLVRELFLNRLGGQSVFIIEPRAEPFPGTATTGAVTTFSVGAKPTSVRFARLGHLEKLGDLSGGRRVRRNRLAAQTRWSQFTRARRDTPQGYVELGDLFRVHRGQVTGANGIWIAGMHSEGLPREVLFPTVTRATELIEAGSVLVDADRLRRVVDLPPDLSVFGGQERRAVDRFLRLAERMGARTSYTARHRRAWWSVGLREPAPVLATYMARRPPAFVVNEADARHLNIAHGLYPCEPLSDNVLVSLVRYLRDSVTLDHGRVYAGGLTKFEPREMERIPVPSPNLLMEMQP